MSDLTLQWLLTTLDVSVKAVLLAAAAALLLRITRLHDSNFRHRIWTGVLLGMLTLPALAQIVPVLRLPFRIPDAWRITETHKDHEAGHTSIACDRRGSIGHGQNPKKDC